MNYNYKDKFKINDRVLYEGKESTIIHVHEENNVNVKVDNDCYYKFNVHPPTQLRLLINDKTT